MDEPEKLERNVELARIQPSKILEGALPRLIDERRCARSSVAADTRYYVDPSFAAAAIGAGPGDLMNDLKTFGVFF